MGRLAGFSYRRVTRKLRTIALRFVSDQPQQRLLHCPESADRTWRAKCLESVRDHSVMLAFSEDQS